MKVYVVISYADGENYEGNLPDVEGVFDTFEKAKEFFEQIKPEFGPDEEDEYEDNDGEDSMFYEITDFSQDYHAILRIVEKEVK